MGQKYNKMEDYNSISPTYICMLFINVNYELLHEVVVHITFGLLGVIL